MSSKKKKNNGKSFGNEENVNEKELNVNENEELEESETETEDVDNTSSNIDDSGEEIDKKVELNKKTENEEDEDDSENEKNLESQKNSEKKDKKTSSKSFFDRKSFKYGSVWLVLVLAVIGIALIVNMVFHPDLLPSLVEKATGKTLFKFDVTDIKQYSLSDVTKNFLNGLQKDVEIYALIDEAKGINGDKQAVEFIKSFAKFSKIKVQFVDVETDPATVTQLDPKRELKLEKNDVVIKCGSKIKRVKSYEFQGTGGMSGKATWDGEKIMTGAISYVVSDTTNVNAYFLTGHGGLSIDSELSKVKEKLQNASVEAKTLNLVTSKEVPQDATIVFIMSPERDISKDEKQRLEDYLKKGGNLFVTIDPLNSTETFKNLSELLNQYNISFRNDIIIEGMKNAIPSNPLYFRAEVKSIPGDEAYTKDLAVVLAESRSLEILKNQKDQLTTTSIISTSSEATSVDKSGKKEKGTYDIAVFAENKAGEKPSKVFAIGDGTFLTNEALDTLPEHELFFNKVIKSIANVEAPVIVESKSVDTKTFKMDSTQYIIMIIVWFAVPILFIGFGIIVWVRRKNL